MDLDEALPLLARQPDAPLDLADVALHLARDEYPALDTEGYLSELAGMAHELRPRLRGSLAARARGLCRYLFHDLGFRGNTEAYYDARNSYFNDVLDRRLGIPITLSAVAMAVGGRAGLRVEGVGLPGHFVAKLTDGGKDVFIDPFHGGRVLTPADCEDLVKSVTGQPFTATPETLTATPLASIVVRMLTNLKGAYLQTRDFARAARVVGRLCQLLPGDAGQRRDLGVSLCHAGQFGRAIDPLTAYLASAPDLDDREVVEKILADCRAQVAKWN